MLELTAVNRSRNSDSSKRTNEKRTSKRENTSKDTHTQTRSLSRNRQFLFFGPISHRFITFRNGRIETGHIVWLAMPLDKPPGFTDFFFRKFIFEMPTKVVRQPSNPGSDWKEILIFGCIRIVLFYEVTVQIRTILKHPKMSYFSNTVLTFQQFPALCSIRTCAIL